MCKRIQKKVSLNALIRKEISPLALNSRRARSNSIGGPKQVHLVHRRRVGWREKAKGIERIRLVPLAALPPKNIAATFALVSSRIHGLLSILAIKRGTYVIRAKLERLSIRGAFEVSSDRPCN
ncbi:uncharacterized protein LOC143178548 [Calliopsis andreniformis]|uniref:uncharacterized protein LOC143178548 n=1 Tax=Calliopsis andreniformis TaxID=337506 RepID=UPI003FCC4784